MTYHLGIDLGTTYTAAAVYENGHATIVDLSGRSATMPSIVFLDEEGKFHVGDAAIRRAAADPARAAQQFKRRFGDTTPLFLGGSPFSADALTGALLKSVIELVSTQQGGPPAGVALTYPANWGGYKLELREQAIRQAGLSNVTTITEPEAAVLHYSQLERVPNGAVVAVFDLGGGTFDAAVIRKTETGTEFLGRPEGIERLGGIDFDDAIFAFVSGHLGGAVEELDLDDPIARTALERLRRECTDAKEALSADEVASIPVFLPSMQTTVRVTRAEFEALARPPLAQAIGALRRALVSAELEPSDLDAVLLAGGSSRIPLVAEMVGNELARPVAVDSHPKQVVALGAALAANSASAAAGVTPTAAVAPPVVASPSAEPEQNDMLAAETVVANPAIETVETVDEAGNSTIAAPSRAPGSGGSRRSRLIAAAAAVVALGAIGAFVLSSAGGGDETDAATGSSTDIPTAPSEVSTESPEPSVPVATESVAASSTTSTTTSTSTSTSTTTTTTTTLFPVDTRQVALTGIATNGSAYEVSYETLNFQPLIAPGSWHIHFHWNTFPPESVGVGANPQGDWQIWDVRSDGAMVFDGFSVADAPAGATAICGVVATDGHTIDAPEYVADTVSCVDLPV